jgi:hypothetical protein
MKIINMEDFSKSLKELNFIIQDYCQKNEINYIELISILQALTSSYVYIKHARTPVPTEEELKSQVEP